MNRRLHVACNFNFLNETERFLEVTGSHIHCKCSDVSEMVQDRDVVTADQLRPLIGSNIMAYRISAISMTLSDFHGHSAIASLSNGIFRTQIVLMSLCMVVS